MINTIIGARAAQNRVLSTHRVVTGSELITLTEVKAHLNKTDSDDDTYLGDLQKACRQAIENYCSVSIVNTSVSVILQNELGGIELPYQPIGSITLVSDINGTVLVENSTYVIRGDEFRWLESPVSSFINMS